jgi:D-3-phosphoglycerate dehydrogenase
VSTAAPFARDRTRVVLLEGIHDSAVAYLRGEGFEDVRQVKGALEDAALRDAIAGAHLVGIRSRTRLDAAALQAAPDLLAVGCFCIGTNQVDLRTAAALGVPVFNAPHSNTRSVAELVTALVVLLVRDVHRKSAAAHAGRWMKTTGAAREVRGKTLGIVGYGHIGSQVSVLAEALGMRVLYHDIETRLPLGNARPVPTLDDLLARADVVTCHVPETPLTRDLLSRERIGRMRPGAYLVNTSRGTVVDLDALADALRSGAVGGAAIDVYPVEPESNESPFDTPLRGIPNVILTPHVAGSTVEAQENIGIEVATKLAAYALGGGTATAVNFPALSLAPPTTSCRILHVHRNVPGVVRQINDLVADEGLNIAGQHLQTMGEIGYVALDVEGAASQRLLDGVRRVRGTIRARIVCP